MVSGIGNDRFWFGLANRYLGKDTSAAGSSVWRCPANRSHSYGWSSISYGANQQIFRAHTQPRVKYARIKRQGGVVMVADSNGDAYYDMLTDGIGPSYERNYPPGNRHSEGTNLLFCDGHVEWKLRNSIYHIATSWNDAPEFIRLLWGSSSSAFAIPYYER